MSDFYWPPKIAVDVLNEIADQKRSESDSIFKKFVNALNSEQEKGCGLYPAVCVAGRFDFDMLYGAAVAMASLTRTIDCYKIAGQSFEFMGVKVFKTHCHDHGFYMGSVET